MASHLVHTPECKLEELQEFPTFIVKLRPYVLGTSVYVSTGEHCPRCGQTIDYQGQSHTMDRLTPRWWSPVTVWWHTYLHRNKVWERLDQPPSE